MALGPDAEDYTAYLSAASTVTPRELWRAMPASRREQGLAAFMMAESDGELREYIRHLLLRESTGFRPQVIRSWGDSELAKHAARLKQPDLHLVKNAVLGLFVFAVPEIQSAFFDAVGIRHVDGVVEGELEVPAADDGRTMAGARVLIANRPGDVLTHLYVLSLCVLFHRMWPALSAAVEPLFGSAANEAGDVAATAVTSVSPSGRSGKEEPSRDHVRKRVDRRPRWTSLDEILIREIIRSVAAVEIDATPNAVESAAKAVRELIVADPMRHRSFHHLGFLDGLLKRDVAATIPVENDVRRRWYHAGWIAGRARVGDSQSIVHLFDTDARVRELGDGGEATEYAAIPVVSALALLDRHSEASRFISPKAIEACDEHFAREVLARATTLLRDDRASEAKDYLKVLEAGLALRESAGLPFDPTVHSDTQRRLAHCLRHERAFPESRAILEALLPTNLEPHHRAMVLADLGLMDADLHRLSAIAFPSSETEASKLCIALERGAPRFAEAASLEAREAAHGDYALGVIALLGGQHEQAFELLERATVQFQGDRERYHSGGLVETSRFFAAVAGMLGDARSLRAREFATRIIEGIRSGQPVPTIFVEDVLIGALDVNEELVPELVEAFLEGNTETALDVILKLDLKGALPEVTEALLSRVDNTHRKTDNEMSLMRTALGALRDLGEYERAAGLMEKMQDLAFERVGVEEFIALLRDDTALAGIWDVDERDATLMALLESKGRYTEAAQLIHDTVHRLLSGERFDRLDQAEDLISRMRGYGEDGRALAHGLEDRLAALTGEFEIPVTTAAQTNYRPTICIVGGDETQRQCKQRMCDWAAQPEVNIDLRFIYSGWTSNWKDYVDEFKRMRASLDGVVVLQLVRTEFGRSIRKLCDGKPQIGTWGRGAKSMQRAAERVAEMVRKSNEESAGGMR